MLSAKNLGLVTLCALVFSTGCSSGPKEALMQGPTMGTSWSVKLVHEQRIDQADLQQQIQSALDDVNRKMSNWDPQSEVSLFNQAPAGCFEVSSDTVEVAEVSQSISRETGGKFDATIGPLINLWGFGPDFSDDQIPAPQRIEELLQLSGYQHFRTSHNLLCKDFHQLQVNFSATAKGFGVDRVALLLEGLGHSRYLVEVGGELRVAGQNLSGGDWVLGIERPADGLSGIAAATINLSSGAVATSGDYRNYFMLDGERISHILDAQSGYPIPQTLASVTVLHESALWADGWATAMLTLGAEEGMRLAEERGLAVLMYLRTEEGFERETSSHWDLWQG